MQSLSFPTRWSAILADLWPASLEPAILPRGPSPPDPHAAGWAGRSASVVLGLWGEMQLFWVDMDRADSLSGGASHPERQVLDYIKTNIHITSSGMLPERLLRHTLDFTGADRSPTIPATGPMPPRSGSSSSHPPPRGACQDHLRQRRGPIPPGLVATAHPPIRRCGQNAKPGRLRAPVQRAYRTLRSAPNVSHAPTLQPTRRTAELCAFLLSFFITQRDADRQLGAA